MKRVVITGLGVLSSIGEGYSETWNNLISCKSGIKRITSFDTSNLSCKIAGFISKEEGSSNYINLEKYIDKKDINRNDRFIQYGLVASILAIKDAGIENLSEEKKLRTGITNYQKNQKN